jgi:hypothetical protein
VPRLRNAFACDQVSSQSPRKATLQRGKRSIASAGGSVPICRRVVASAHRVHLRPSDALSLLYTPFLAEIADALGRDGKASEGLLTIDEALARSERSEECWCVAELLRIKGELILREGAPRAATVAEGRGALFALARLGAPTGRPVMGAENVHKPFTLAV